MAALAPALPFISAGLSVLGAFQQAGAQKAAAQATQQQDNYIAAQEEQNAGQQRAASQREFLTQQRDKQLTESKALSLAAASGGGARDPSVIDVMGDLESQGNYNANMSLANGESRARSMESDAAAKRYGGRIAVDNADNEVLPLMLSAGASAAGTLYSKYAPGPSPTASSSLDSVYADTQVINGQTMVNY